MRSSSDKKINVLLVDDHALVRTGLRLLLEQQPNITVVGEAANHQQALDSVAREQPDIILLDLDLGGESSLSILPHLLRVAPEARVILVTGVREPEEHQRAIQQGAMGVVRKEEAPTILVHAIERVYAGEVWLEPALVARALGGMTRPYASQVQHSDPEVAKIGRLTKREREIVQLVLQGLQNKQIAERLVISEVTVSHHLTSIFNKLDLTNRFDLIIYAYRHNIVAQRQ